MALGSIHGPGSARGLSLLLALSVLAANEGFLCEYSTSAAKTKSLTFTREPPTHSSPLGVPVFRDLAIKKAKSKVDTRLNKPVAWSSPFACAQPYHPWRPSSCPWLPYCLHQAMAKPRGSCKRVCTLI